MVTWCSLGDILLYVCSIDSICVPNNIVSNDLDKDINFMLIMFTGDKSQGNNKKYVKSFMSNL